MTYTEAIQSTPTVLVEFYATWCPHCQRMMPIVAQIKEMLAGKVDVYQYEIDQQRQLADENNVQSIPTFIIYKNGKEAWRQSGEMEANALLSKVQHYM